MPRYHFNLKEERDVQGSELDSLDIARCDALKIMSGLVCDGHADAFWGAGEWTMTVTDADHLTLFQLTLVGTEAPAIRRGPAAFKA